MALPGPSITWPSQTWVTYNWTADSTGGYPFNPTWHTLPQYSSTNTFDISAVGTLVEATHINQYYTMFGVSHWPRMQSSTTLRSVLKAL